MSITRLRRAAVAGMVFATLTANMVSGIARAEGDGRTIIASSNPQPSPNVATWNHPIPAATLGRPVPLATLGRPIATSAQANIPNAEILIGAASLQRPQPQVDPALAPVTYQTTNGMQDYTARSQAPDPPPPSSPIVGSLPPPPTGIAPPVPPPLSAGDIPPPPPAAPFGAPPAAPYGIAVDQPIKKSFFDRCREFFDPGNPDSKCGGWFQSDHAFDNFTNCGDLISPVSSPFLCEDPRALTEVRPIFFVQTAPNSNPVFHGGNSEFLGVQARLAINDQWSVVINELGAVFLQPHDSDVPGFTNASGFAEFDIGPKWTFYRNVQAGRVAAFGVTFQIPTGGDSVYQNTGSLSINPYLSFGQTFGRSDYGTFNFLASGGFSASVDDERSDYLHMHLHLDYDVLNMHTIYPLIEVNWMHNTSFGKQNSDIGTEGYDLVNFGSPSYDGARDIVTLALGARYKFGGSDHYQVGTSFEFPLTDRKDLTAFRYTLDFIIRY